MRKLLNNTAKVLVLSLSSIFILGGISMLASGSIGAGAFLLLSGFSVFPPLWNLLLKKFNFELKIIYKIILCFIFMVSSTLTMPEINEEDKIVIKSNNNQDTSEMTNSQLTTTNDGTKDSIGIVEQQVPDPSPKTPINSETELMDELWRGADKSLRTRKGVDIRYDNVMKTVYLDYMKDSYWDENEMVRVAFSNLVKFGSEVFSNDAVESLTVTIKAEFTDSFGKKGIDSAVIIEMLKEDFYKFEWENLSMLPVSDQIKSVAIRYYIHPSLLNKIDKEKLYLSL